MQPFVEVSEIGDSKRRFIFNNVIETGAVFHPDMGCPKCMGEHMLTLYCTGRLCKHECDFEHLVVICSGCRYSVNMRCSDQS